jgi:hypothetical protein
MNALTRSLRQFKKNFDAMHPGKDWLKTKNNPASSVRMENYLAVTKRGRIGTRRLLRGA